VVTNDHTSSAVGKHENKTRTNAWIGTVADSFLHTHSKQLQPIVSRLYVSTDPTEYITAAFNDVRQMATTISSLSPDPRVVQQLNSAVYRKEGQTKLMQCSKTSRRPCGYFTTGTLYQLLSFLKYSTLITVSGEEARAPQDFEFGTGAFYLLTWKG